MKKTTFPKLLGKPYFHRAFVAVFMFFGILLISNSATAQCGPCDVQIEANGNLTGVMKDGATVCISGNRTTAINFNNTKDITICIADGAS